MTVRGDTLRPAWQTKIAWLVLLLGLALSGVAFYVVARAVAREGQLRFESAAADAHFAIEAQLRSYIQVLIGLQALFNAEQNVSRADFARYVDRARYRGRSAAPRPAGPGDGQRRIQLVGHPGGREQAAQHTGAGHTRPGLSRRRADRHRGAAPGSPGRLGRRRVPGGR